MKANLLTFVSVVALGAATLRAQTPSDQPSVYVPPAPAPYVPPPPPPPAAPYGYGYNEPGSTMAGSVTIPYAFNWNAAGVSAELGGLWGGHHFLGGEVSYYDGNSQRYNVFNFNRGGYVGSFNSSQKVTTVDLAYKYFMPLWNLGPSNPVSFYIGGSAGVGFVSYSDTGAGYGFTNANNNNGDFTAEFVAGLNVSISQNAAIRLGYRYVGVDDVTQFNRNVDIDSSVLEAGVSFRF